MSRRTGVIAPLCLSIALAPLCARPREACPFVGHNTYGEQGGRDRLAAALASGIPGLEIDVSWGKLRRNAVVTHNKVTTGFGHPELGGYVAPIWPAWQAEADRVLMIDLKSGEDGVARRVHEVLSPHAARLSRMQPGGAFRQGRITVYLSGSGGAQAAYERHARARGEYLAFGAHAFEREDWWPDAAGYAPAGPPDWRRYVNMDIRCFMKRRQEGETDLSQLAPARISAAAAACATAGYPIRVWTVNARRGAALDAAPWRACVDAGIGMIATDDYADAMKFWSELAR